MVKYFCDVCGDMITEKNYPFDNFKIIRESKVGPCNLEIQVRILYRQNDANYCSKCIESTLKDHELYKIKEVIG